MNALAEVARGNLQGCRVLAAHECLRADLNLAGVTTNSLAMAEQRVALLGEGCRIAGLVPAVGQLRDEPEAALQTLRPGPDRWSAGREGWRIAYRIAERVRRRIESHTLGRTPQLPDEPGRRGEHRDPLADGRERHAVHGVLLLVPSCAQPKHEAPSRDVVHGGSGLGGQRRMSVGVAEHQVTKLEPAGASRERGQGHERLVASSASLTQRNEVIEDPRRVEDGELVAELPGGQEGWPVNV